jgi:protein-tyrosine-phosphatase
MVEVAARDPQIELQLRHVVDGLVNHTGGTLTRERLTAIVDEFYEELSSTAHIQTFVPVMVGRAALTQVRAELIQAGEVLKTMPEVLIVCQENAGRSQAAAALFRYYAPGRLYVVSAGVRPKGHVLEEVTNGLASQGVYLTDIPKRYSPEMLAVADHLIVIGAVDEEFAPVDGQDRHHWDDISPIEDVDPTAIPAVLHEIEDRVRRQLALWLPEMDLGEPVMTTP